MNEINDGKVSVIIGRNAVVEALDRGDVLQKVLFQKGITGEFEREIRNKCKANDVPYQPVPFQMLNKWSKGNHQGVIAIGSPVQFFELADVINHCYEKGRLPFLLALDEVQDVRNLGAIVRSAEIFGVDAVIFPSKGSAMINDFAIKSSAGAVLITPLVKVNSLQNALSEMKNFGIQIYGADMDGSIAVQDLQVNEPLCILMGSEGKGIRPHLERMLDATFSIPQYGQTESLNVGVAASIAMHHVSLKRNASKE